MRHHHHHHAAPATQANTVALSPPAPPTPAQQFDHWALPFLILGGAALGVVVFGRLFKPARQNWRNWRMWGRAAFWAIGAAVIATFGAQYLFNPWLSQQLGDWIFVGQRRPIGLALDLAPLLVGALVGGGAAAFFEHRQQGGGGRNWPAPLRGTWIRNGLDWRRRTVKLRQKAAKTGAATHLRFAGCWIPFEDETKHFLAMGTTGSGKSTALRQLMVDAANRGDRAIVADPDGGFLARFYNPARGDIILNPLDARSAQWNPMAEITSPHQADDLARSLIPDIPGADGTWASYARTLVASVLRQAPYAGLNSASEIYQAVAIASADDLRTLLAPTAASSFLAVGNEKMFGSIRATAVDAIKALEHVGEGGGAAFSVANWAKSNSKAWVFMPYQADQIATLKGLIATWLRIAIFATMSRGEGDSRTWFVVDELDALGRIDGLADALQRLRKFGGRCALGFQSIGPLSAIYGDGIAAAITENTGVKLILRCSASDGGGTSRFASHLIGEREVMKQTTTSGSHSSGSWTSGGSSGSSDGVSWTRAKEDAVYPSEIEGLQDRVGYLRAPSWPLQWYVVGFPFDDLPRHTPAFQPR